MSGKSGGVDIRGVNVSYGSNHVLKNVDLAIRPGEFFAFLGPSGCGKTTLLRLIAGFNQATSGEVLARWRRHHAPAAVGAQRRHGLPELRALAAHDDRAQCRLWPRGTPPAARRDRSQSRQPHSLSSVSKRSLRATPRSLSGGQQQRVALARTIAIEPKVLLLDEPLSNLDAQMRLQVRRELRELQQRLGLTAIFVTHDQEEANAIADTIAVMRDGVIQQVGAPHNSL